MFYKATDTDTSHSDWIALNTNAIDGQLIVLAHPAIEVACESIVWLNPPEPEAGDEDPPLLHGGLVPAWSTVWTPANAHDDRPELREALDASGFDLFEVQHPEHPIEFFFGVDGAGYSFYGAHWIPLRARLLASRLLWWLENVHDNNAKRSQWEQARACAGRWEADMAKESEDLHTRAPELYEALRQAEAQIA